jgi:hypothetical protein
LSLTANETMFRIDKKWRDEVSNFDKIFDQALLMADTISKAISKQFASKI